MAVQAASENLSSGIGVVLLMYATDVIFPELMRIYPVGITSIRLFLRIGAACTCCPIRRSGLRPEINDRKRIASAEGSICSELPGNRTTGILTFSFNVL